MQFDIMIVSLQHLLHSVENSKSITFVIPRFLYILEMLARKLNSIEQDDSVRIKVKILQIKIIFKN